MNDLIHQVLIPALQALFMTGIIPLVLKRMNRPAQEKVEKQLEVTVKKVEENTNITNDAADDAGKGFKDIGQWRQKMDVEMAVLKTKIDHMENQRIPTSTQSGYKRPEEPVKK